LQRRSTTMTGQNKTEIDEKNEVGEL